jgi:hypothetical protein
VRGVNLTDDELWRAIAQNTESMSTFIQQQLELNARPGGSQTMLANSYARRISLLERQYRIYTAELRRRYVSSKQSA